MAKNPTVKTPRKMSHKMPRKRTSKSQIRKEPVADNYRGTQRLDMKTCISCSACALICPNSTITMVDTETERGTKKMPEINLERCLFCGLCEEVCPTGCLTMSKNHDGLVTLDRRTLIKRPEELK